VEIERCTTEDAEDAEDAEVQSRHFTGSPVTSPTSIVGRLLEMKLVAAHAKDRPVEVMPPTGFVLLSSASSVVL
jgi:hypothetical protein